MFDLFRDQDFQLNLLAEGFGVVSDLVLFTILLNALVAWRENRRFKPVQALVARQLFITYGLILIASKGVIERIDDKEKSLFIRRQLLAALPAHIARLERAIDMNAATLKGPLLPAAIEFSTASTKLLAILTFAVEAFDPDRANEDFLLESPFAELRVLSGSFGVFNRNFSSAGTPCDKAPHVTDVMIAWDRIGDHQPNLWMMNSERPLRGAELLHVIDAELARRVRVPDTTKYIRTANRVL